MKEAGVVMTSASLFWKASAPREGKRGAGMRTPR